MTNSDYILIIDIGIPLNLLVIILHLMGCGFLLLFEKTIHPWRQLGKERESHCWGKLQGTKRGIEAEPTLWDQVNLSSSHFKCSLSLSQEGKEQKEVDDEQQQHSYSNQVARSSDSLSELFVNGGAGDQWW